MDVATRAQVCATAITAARTVAYEGAGTVEFIADANQGLSADRIWFNEMNTRLQVEHPVTEAITGQDLVEWQLRVASGEPLPLRQEEIAISGWAIEARLYAEDPATGFLPSTGPLTHFRLPHGIRIDSGLEEGGEVSPYYDPMMAKLIAAGPSRTPAAARLARACSQVEVWPIKTNAAFLVRTLSDPDFVAANIDTEFIDARLDRLTLSSGPSEEIVQAAARARLARDRDPAAPWRALEGFRLNAPPCLQISLQSGDTVHQVKVVAALPAALATLDTKDGIVVFAGGDAYAFTDPRLATMAGGPASGSIIHSPMPGRIVAVRVRLGDRVAKGQPLVILEAMKMEHILTAPFEGTVASISAAEGNQVSEGVVLARIDGDS